jgi:hypothetical protein
MSIQSFLLITMLSWTSIALYAETYYVDYQAGNDKADGTSKRSPWKHCPADEQATDKAAACSLRAGDRIIFKGGVRYYGAISKKITGSANKPIIFDGNTDGSFGDGMAIIDGSAPLSNWQVCKSKSDADGNEHFKEIWYTDVPYKGNWRGLNLLGAKVPMHVSQHPNPADPLYQERVSEYTRSKTPMKRVDKTLTFSDPENLSGKPDDYYKGMGLCFHGGHNAAVHVNVLSFDSKTQTITTNSFTDMVSKGKLYKDGLKYCFFNSVKIIDQAGEYAMHRLDEETVRIFVWPQELKDKQPYAISRSNKDKGFSFNDTSHVHVYGFKIERQGGKKAHGIQLSNCKDIVFENCEVSQVRGSAGVRATDSEDVTLQDCYVHQLPGHTFGTFFRRCKNVKVINTRIHKPTATALDFYTVTGGVVRGCEISGFTGMHANGITFYLGNRDILIERNYVHSGNVPMTIKQSGDVVIRNNIFDGGNRSFCIGMWSTSGHEKQYWSGPILQSVQIYNNTFIRAATKHNWQAAIFSNMQNQPQGLVVKNNIIDGVSGRLNGSYTHNIYTRSVKKEFMGEGSLVVKDLKTLFVDPDNNDFRPAKGSPAIGAGVDVGVAEDFAGNKRTEAEPTIGAFAGL